VLTRNKHTGDYEATCDHCSTEYEDLETSDFLEAIRLLKELGWYIFKDEEDEWNHSCPNCGMV